MADPTPRLGGAERCDRAEAALPPVEITSMQAHRQIFHAEKSGHMRGVKTISA